MTLAAKDPLNRFRGGAYAGPRPVPLAATAIRVAVDGGIATVTTTRTFRNTEDRSIEATITFPVPVDAVMTGLTADIAGRVLTASAQPREAARATYEDAVTDGKSAVLHEEAIKGVHILTAGHIPPGAEIKVESRWVQPLSFASGLPGIRIPTTVGHVYGRSPLSETDDLVADGPTASASLEVSCPSGAASVVGHALLDGKADMPLDAPIDIQVTGWSPKPVEGTVAGRKVAISLDRSPARDARVSLSVLVDRSGSMRYASGHRGDGSASKADVLRRGLEATFASLWEDDTVELWQFSDSVERVGSATGPRDAVALLSRVRSPGGGTETGIALSEVISRNPEGDILLLTDGKSHALDVHKLAGSGCRVSVVLIGEDSLEAMVGHLATLSGGQLFVAPSHDTGPSVAAAVAACRLPHGGGAVPGGDLPDTLELDRGGARISLAFGAPSEGVDDAGAYAAGLVLPWLSEARATEVACAAGIVSHLSSLVLVDEEGGTQEGLPEMRKVSLPVPRTERGGLRALHASAYAGGGVMRSSFSSAPLGGARGALRSLGHPPVDLASFAETSFVARESAPPAPRTLAGLAATVAWAGGADRLLSGDLTVLDKETEATVRALAARPDIRAVAKASGRDAVLVVLAMLATTLPGNRYASRFARKLSDLTGRADFAAAFVSSGIQAA
mgnify:CR=1 FL=1